MLSGNYPVRSNIPECYYHTVRLLGADGADPTAVFGGGGVTVTRTGEGAYRATFAESMGTFVGIAGVGFGATTPGDLKGYTVVEDAPFDTTNRRQDFVIYNSSFSAADIITAQWLCLTLCFRRTAVS